MPTLPVRRETLLAAVVALCALARPAAAAGMPAGPPDAAPVPVGAFVLPGPPAVVCQLRGPSVPDGPATREVRVEAAGPYEVALAFPGSADRPAETWRLVADPVNGLFLRAVEWTAVGPESAGERTGAAVEPPLALAMPGAPSAGGFRSEPRFVFAVAGGGEPETLPCLAESSWTTGRFAADGMAWPETLRVSVRLEFPDRSSDDVAVDRTDTLVFARGLGFVHRWTSVDPEDPADDETLTRVADPPR